MGLRASDTRGITFEDVRVPKEVRNRPERLTLIPNCMVPFLNKICRPLSFNLIADKLIVRIVCQQGVIPILRKLLRCRCS